MALFRSKKKKFVKRRTGKLALAGLWFRRFGFALGIGIFAIWIGAWLHFSDSFTKTGDWVQQKTLDITADMGFTVENILVEGRVHSDPEVLRAIINVQKGEPLFSFNPKEAKTLVERIAWVRYAHVERRLPDTIYIALEERRPLALWQKDKKLRLIDDEGKEITGEGLSKFKELIMVMGKGAPEHAPELLANLSVEAELYKRADHARRIENRRWDLVLDKDIVVKLPEDDLGLALRRLAVAHDENDLLDKDIRSIDLRESDRIVVRTKPGAVQEYKAGFKRGNNI